MTTPTNAKPGRTTKLSKFGKIASSRPFTKLASMALDSGPKAPSKKSLHQIRILIEGLELITIDCQYLLATDTFTKKFELICLQQVNRAQSLLSIAWKDKPVDEIHSVLHTFLKLNHVKLTMSLPEEHRTKSGS